MIQFNASIIVTYCHPHTVARQWRDTRYLLYHRALSEVNDFFPTGNQKVLYMDDFVLSGSWMNDMVFL